MSRRDRINTHAARAIEELDCARHAACAEAAHAHLELSELHLKRMRELSRATPPPALRLVAWSGDERRTYVNRKFGAG
jgi:hypothetical protein